MGGIATLPNCGELLKLSTTKHPVERLGCGQVNSLGYGNNVERCLTMDDLQPTPKKGLKTLHGVCSQTKW